MYSLLLFAYASIPKLNIIYTTQTLSKIRFTSSLVFVLLPGCDLTLDRDN